MSELRQDLVSGDWTIIAPGRSARPQFLEAKRKKRKTTPRHECPFEDLEKSGNWPALFAYPSDKNWQIALIPNKYPALMRSTTCSVLFREGIYRAKTGIGAHNLLLTRTHEGSFADLSPEMAKRLLEIFQACQIMMAKDKCAAYVSSFLNYGPTAGASISHPHYQLISLPVVPPHVVHSLRGAKQFFNATGKCVRCEILKSERKDPKRVVEEGKHAIVIAPYASKRPFELSILPKRHFSSLAKTPKPVVHEMALLLRSAMRRMQKYLHDPDMNFFIHDAPVDRRNYDFHHWHIEIVPTNVVSPPGGFEVSTAININAVAPEMAAAVLKGKK